MREYRFRDAQGGAGGVTIGDASAGSDYHDNRSRQHPGNRGGVNAGRDLTVGRPSLGQDLELLSQALAELRLTTAERKQAARQLHAARNATDANDRARIGGHLHSFAELLNNAGALATAGTSVVDALTRIGRWLGPLGAAVLAQL